MALVLSGKKQTLIPQSQEEDDQLLRSAKKIKSGSKFMGKNSYQEQWPKLGTNGQPSFAEKLKGIDRNEDQYDDDNEEEDSAYSDDSMSDNTIQDMEKEKEDPLFKTIEDPVRNFPTFTFSGKMKKRLFRAWRKAVIVKLLDRNIGYKALQTRLQALWAKRGAINLINIGHGFYVVKLSNKEDYFNALTGGPWMIYDHYLTVRPWEPNFRLEKAKIDKVAVWIRIPKMPLEYYDEEALTMIGNRIGETLKVDMNTSCQLRGHYARLCVLVDLEKQLMPGFALDGDEYYMEYEGLHSLCTICGFYGHRKEVCPNKVNQPQEAMDMGKEQINEITKSTSEANTSLRSAEQWKVVQKSRRQRKPKENKGEASRPENRGSRFGVLADMTEQGNDAGGEEEVRTEKEQVKGPQAMVQWGNGRQRSNTGRRQGRTIEYSERRSGVDGVGLQESPKINEVRESDGLKRKEKRMRQLMDNEVTNGGVISTEQGRDEENHEEKKEMRNENMAEEGDNACDDEKEENGLGLNKGNEIMDHDLELYQAKHNGQQIGLEELDPGDKGLGFLGLVGTSPMQMMNEVMEEGEHIMVAETQFEQNT